MVPRVDRVRAADLGRATNAIAVGAVGEGC
jgi:hypothetical protein